MASLPTLSGYLHLARYPSTKRSQAHIRCKSRLESRLMTERKSFDVQTYVQRIKDGPCFICEMVAGRLEGNHIVHQDESAIVFLNKYPSLYGYVLVAPVEHREQVTGDFTVDEYLALQRV